MPNLRVAKTEDEPDLVDQSLTGWIGVLPKEALAAFEAAVRLERVSLMARKEISDRAFHTKVGAGDADVLGVLFENGPPYALQPKILAARCFVTTGAMTGRLDRLEKAGFARRVRSSDDRRALEVQLTEAGREVALELASALQSGQFHRALSALKPGDLKSLSEILKRVERAFLATPPLPKQKAKPRK